MMSTSQSPIQFDFGKNWEAFSKTALSRDKVRQAQFDFQNLLEGVPLKDRSFLDIGFGQGLSLLSAASAGANCLGIDINPRCIQVLDENWKNFFPEIVASRISTFQGSILDPDSIEKLKSHRFAKSDGFDIVHSWGVLHHSGAMVQAIQNSAALVDQGGHLILAIYQAHWSSPLWKQVKYLYNRSPSFIRPLWIWFFYPIIYLAKRIATGKNPKQKNRGMDFYYDVVDWVGGHPYEYATQTEIITRLKELGFSLVRFQAPVTPTGCMEFVFQKELVRS